MMIPERIKAVVIWRVIMVITFLIIVTCYPDLITCDVTESFKTVSSYNLAVFLVANTFKYLSNKHTTVLQQDNQIVTRDHHS